MQDTSHLIDCLDSKTLKDRFLNYKNINKERLSVASAILSVEALKMLEILPLFLHYNDPKFPCYVEGDVPYGIDNFEENDRQKAYLNKVCHGQSLDPVLQKDRLIYSIYAMGSTSSVGQGAKSDLDIWICVRANIDKKALALLNEKCKLISTIAHTKGVDLNLFVTKEDRFTNNICDLLDSDNCGSAQNLLLLDEFYRSAIHLYGRYLIWYLIDTKREFDNYSYHVSEAFLSGGLKREDFFDFGSVTITTPAEYFGSALWLLYKGIDSPFKATVKILLMESYSYDFPNTKLLCSSFKDNLHKNKHYTIDLDAYYLMYLNVANYLQKKNDHQRLLLIRMCFYLKIYDGIEGIKSSRIVQDKLDLLNSLSTSWQWSKSRILRVQNSGSWHVDYVQKLYEILFRSLLKSYRELLRFSVRQGIEYAITSDDAAILSRKLFVAFDRYEGKINIFTSDFAKNLEERHLTFIKPSKRSICQKSWHVYPAALNSVSILEVNCVFVGKKISECVAWACFNGFLTSRTEVDLAGNIGHVSSKNIKDLAYDIKHTLMQTSTIASDESLQRPREIKACLVVLNFDDDVTEYTQVSSLDLTMGSSLCYGRNRSCLVGSIDLVLVNSWGEMRSIPLPSGEDGVLELIVTLVLLSRISAFYSARQITDLIKVRSYSKHHKDLIRFDVLSLIRSVFMLQNKDRDSNEFNFDVGANSYIAVNSGERGIRVSKSNVFNTDDAEVNIISDYGMRPEYFLQVPAIVERYSTLGIMQYFFVPLVNKAWRIIIVNESNEVEIYPHYEGSRSNLVNAINRFYIKQTEENESADFMHFNLPQYFVLNDDLKSIHPFTIRVDA